MPWAVAEPKVEISETYCRRAAAASLLREKIHYLIFKGTEYVGNASFHRIDWKVPSLEIGYWLATPFTGQGLMTEAVRAMTAMAHTELRGPR